MQYVQGDPFPSQPWDSESDLLRDTLINAVRMIRMGYTNEEMHNEWCDRYRASGWVYGPEKNAIKKTHPCLVSYYELPAKQRHKTEVIRAIVINLSII
jgi:hypothetical protein